MGSAGMGVLVIVGLAACVVLILKIWKHHNEVEHLKDRFEEMETRFRDIKEDENED